MTMHATIRRYEAIHPHAEMMEVMDPRTRRGVRRIDPTLTRC